MEELDYEIKDPTALPEPLRPLYAQDPDTGAYRLKVKGVVPKTKLDEFRATNTRLQKEQQELAARYAGLDPEEHRRIKGELEQIKTGSGEAFKATLERHISAERERYEAALKAAQAEREGIAAKLAAREGATKRAELTGQLRRMLDAGKIQLTSEGAFEDLKARFERHYDVDLDTGRVVRREGVEGEEGPKAWLSKRLADPIDRHLFVQGQGGGAKGGDSRPQTGRLTLTRAQAAAPTEDQLKAIAAGKVDYAD